MVNLYIYVYIYIWYGYQLLVSKQSSAFLVWHVGDLKKLLHLLKSLKAFASYLRFRILGTIHDVMTLMSICAALSFAPTKQAANKPIQDAAIWNSICTLVALSSWVGKCQTHPKTMPRDELNFDLP